MRAARKRCESDIYHVIVRGVGKQMLFEDDADRLFFLRTLAEQRAEREVELYAWCLMSNHELKALDKRRRDQLLVALRRAGLSARQIGRLTSIGENIIYRAK